MHLLVSLCHSTLHFLFLLIVLNHYPYLLPTKDLSLLDFSLFILPVGIITGIELTLSSWSQLDLGTFVSIMSQSSPAILCLFFLWIMNLLVLDWKSVFFSAFLMASLFITILFESYLNYESFVLLQVSCILVGLKWSLIYLVKSQPDRRNAVAFMYYFSPLSALSLLGAFLVHDQFFPMYVHKDVVLRYAFITCLGSILTFLHQMTFLKVMMVCRPLTFSVGFAVKQGIMAIVFSTIPLSQFYWATMILPIGFSLRYLIYRYQKPKKQHLHYGKMSSQEALFSTNESNVHW
jgi:hypothetical protein